MNTRDPLTTPGSPVLYALGLISEEGTEIGQLAFKTNRFGTLSVNPLNGVGNLELFQKELTDLVAAVRIANFELVKQGLTPLTLFDESEIEKKINKVRHFAQISLDEGLLTEPLVIMT